MTMGIVEVAFLAARVSVAWPRRNNNIDVETNEFRCVTAHLLGLSLSKAPLDVDRLPFDIA